MVYKALVVDDNPHLCDLFSRAFKQVGFDVVTATSGSEALASLQERPIDVMILDIDMPGMSGFEVLRALRKSEKTRKAHVIVATGSKRAYMHSDTKLADLALVKPVGLRQITVILERLLQNQEKFPPTASTD